MNRMKNLSVALFLGVLLYSCDSGQTPGTTDPANTTTEAAASPEEVKTDSGPFQLDPLKYKYADLEKSFDAKTMEIHYSKHYLGYANNLNKAIANTPMAAQSIEDIMKNLDMSNAAVRNNGGGYYNHRLFFDILSANGGGQPSGVLAEAINKEFGSFDSLKAKLSDAGSRRFGSGWAWLVVNNGKLQVGSTPNQDNPLMPSQEISGIPILGLDVWEHAYYLRYQNKRADYINAFFDVVDWANVGARYEAAIK